MAVSTTDHLSLILGLTIDAKTTLDTLSGELDATWQAVAVRLPDKPAIQLSENTEGKTELSLGALDKLEEPNSLLQLRAAVADLMLRVDLPEIILEIAAVPVSLKPSPMCLNAVHGLITW